MRRRLSTRLCRYEPRLLSRSTTILKPSSKTRCSIVSRTFDAAIGFSVSLFGVRFRVEGVSARTGAILIRDRNLLRPRGQRSTGILPAGQNCESTSETPAGPTRKMRPLHNTLTQELMFSGEQILHEIVTAFIRVARGAGEMMIDSHPGGAAKIICDGKNFIGWFPLTEQPLRVRTGRANREQFRGDSDESGKEQLFPIEFRAEPRHGMKQTACEAFACARCIINMATQCAVQIVDPPGAGREPLTRVPAGVKFSGSKYRFHPLRRWQRGVENCATDFQMRIKRLARDEQTHDLARAFENRIDPAVAQKTLHWNSRFAATF